jgi:hypothetical protein
MNFTKHDVTTNNTREITIKKVIIKKCSFFYEFEEILEDSLIITSSFIMKSRRSNHFNIEYRKVRENTKNTSNTTTQNSADIVDKDYEKRTREDNEMKKNNSDLNSQIENLD